jgi:hypothetical protein
VQGGGVRIVVPGTAGERRPGATSPGGRMNARIRVSINRNYVEEMSKKRNLTELESFATVPPFVNEDLRRAAQVLSQYSDMNIGLTDAANVVIAGRYKATQLLTLDGHYRAIRPLHGGSFTTLPGGP